MYRSALVALALALLATASGCGGDSKDKKSDCQKACEKSAAAKCANDDPVNVCVSSCNALLADVTCQAEAKAFVACVAKSATFSCDVDGYSIITAGCTTEGTTYFNCLP